MSQYDQQHITFNDASVLMYIKFLTWTAKDWHGKISFISTTTHFKAFYFHMQPNTYTLLKLSKSNYWWGLN